jgi:hypothetical protein
LQRFAGIIYNIFGIVRIATEVTLRTDLRVCTECLWRSRMMKMDGRKLVVVLGGTVPASGGTERMSMLLKAGTFPRDSSLILSPYNRINFTLP